MLLAETRQARHQPDGRERHRRGDGEHVAGARFAQLARGLAQLAEGRGHDAVIGLAGIGERERLVAALEERHAHELLQRLDLAAHRRLREEELGPRAREGQVARGRLEAAQQVQRGQRTVGC
jgi:hypothetical protein